ncbi:MAG: hypothetical protein A2Z37_10385 [Chloroflexi bacterium RBG_19FT_COMBO_62_14]|nr:MAG: hypothetical protein A2Z37_10385 [Chloroflexi bacterium RBG_19FT_COMBO_62_14]
MTGGRAVAILLILGGVVLGSIGLVWLGSSVAGGSLKIGGALIGAAFLAALLLPMGGIGVFLFVRSVREIADQASRSELRRILDIVQSRGQIPVSDLAIELQTTRDEVQRHVHELVGLGLFSGYINWEEGVLFSSEAAGLRKLDKCRHCGGELRLVGKGVVTCRYCGTEYFLV